MRINTRITMLFAFLVWPVPSIGAQPYTLVFDTYQASNSNSPQAFQAWVVERSRQGTFDKSFFECLSALEKSWYVKSKGQNDICDRLPHGALERLECQRGNVAGELIAWSLDLRAVLSGHALWGNTDSGRRRETAREACKRMPAFCAQIKEGVAAFMPAVKPMLLCLPNGSSTSGRSEILSSEAITMCLKQQRAKLTRGELTARRLINACFVNVPLPSDEFERAERREIALARELKLTMEDAIPIEEYGYDLFSNGDQIGSRTVFEALVLMNPWSSYYHNMVGSNDLVLRRHQEALRSFNRAVEEWPEYTHALLNRAKTLILLGRKSEALKDLRAVIKFDDEPGTPSAKIARGLIRKYY